MDIKHTDLALEAKKIWENTAQDTTSLPGVKARTEDMDGYEVTTVDILDDTGSEILCKPKGKYITVELGELIARKNGAFESGAMVLAKKLREVLPQDENTVFLVVGLGNRNITPDVIGPRVSEMVLATRHLVMEDGEDFPFFKNVSVISPGVLGTTGIESADIIVSLSGKINAGCIIAVDALYSASLDRLCRTVQISDSGIVPGSGVGNARSELSRGTIGIPVIGIGVPTVTSVMSAAEELFGTQIPQGDGKADLFVTPRDIDVRSEDISKLIAYGINLAIHKGLTVSDIDMLV